MRRRDHRLSKPVELLRAVARQIRHISKHKLLFYRKRATREYPNLVYFYPEHPHPYSVCYQLLHRLGIEIVNQLPPVGSRAIVFSWKDDTYQDPLLPNAFQITVNGNCTDISKAKVETVHSEVFGYSLGIDPRAYVGRMVVKSNNNGAHDGMEVTGPVHELEEQSIYQRIVNNTPPSSLHVDESRGQMVCDMRIPIFMGQPNFLYLKVRPKAMRFSNTNQSVKIANIDDLLKPGEVNLISCYCKSFGIDYGEIDVVRDADDGRIYILDVNKTPHGPPNGLSRQDRVLAFARYENAFEKTFSQLWIASGHQQ